MTTREESPGPAGGPDGRLSRDVGRSGPDLDARSSAPLQGRVLLFAFVGLMVGNTMSGLDSTIVATAAPTIVGELGSLSLLPWVATAYLLTQIATLPVYGKLGDLLGRKRLFLVAVAIFTVSSLLCAAAQTLPQLIAARALQGAGAGGLTGLAMALVADISPARRLGRLLGYAGLVFAVTSVVGPLAGGLFVDRWSWRWAFLINVPSALVCVALVATLVPAQPARTRRRIDVLGALLLAGISTTVVLATSWGGVEIAWLSLAMAALSVLVVVLVVAFVLRERRAPEPILPLRVFRERQVLLAIGANLIAGVAFFGGIVFMPVFFQAVSGRSATVSGMLLVPLAVSTALTTVAVGQAVDRFGGAKAFPVIGMVLIGTGFAFASTVDAETSTATLAAAGLVIGVGIGCVMQVLLLVVQRSVRVEDIGVATSTTVLGRIFGGALGVAAFGAVFNQRLTAEVAARLPAGSVAAGDLRSDPGGIATLPAGLVEPVREAFASALGAAFAVGVPLAVVGVVLTVALPARSVRERLAAADQ